MKKILVLAMFVAVISVVSATTWFEVDQADAKTSYSPSDIITINVVTSDTVSGITVDAITDNGAGGTASEPQVFNAGFEVQTPGTLNSNGMLVEYFFASDTTIPIVGFSGILYSFEYHVPSIPGAGPSRIITIGTFFDDDLYLAPEISLPAGDSIVGNFTSLDLHVIPEPATMALLGLGGILFRRKMKK